MEQAKAIGKPKKEIHSGSVQPEMVIGKWTKPRERPFREALIRRVFSFYPVSGTISSWSRPIGALAGFYTSAAAVEMGRLR